MNLYIVRANKTSLLCNQTCNILFGCVLMKADRQQIEILAFKKPSSIIPVEYKKILMDLYSQEISPNFEENIAIRKNIANISFGLLENYVIRIETARCLILFENVGPTRAIRVEPLVSLSSERTVVVFIILTLEESFLF